VSTVLEYLRDDNITRCNLHLLLDQRTKEPVHSQRSVLYEAIMVYSLRRPNSHDLTLQLAPIQNLLLNIHIDPMTPIRLQYSPQPTWRF
jgi:hypothetical protein